MTPEPTAGARWLQTRPSDLVAETLSDETLVIDTVSGVFFSLRGVASVFWSMLAGTATTDELRVAVRERFADAHDRYRRRRLRRLPRGRRPRGGERRGPGGCATADGPGPTRTSRRR